VVRDMEDRLKTVSIKGLREIGRGATSRVYQLDDERIIKVFYPWIRKDEIERERNTSRRALIKGIPATITFEMVHTEEGYGIIFELVDTDTLAEAVRKEPDKLEHYALAAADVLKILHSTHYNIGELPDTRENWWNLCSMGLVRYLTDQQAGRVHRFLMELPCRDTFIHGDYHAQNIMVKNGELILIDLGESSLGHPVFDLSGVYMSCEQLQADNPKLRILSAEQWDEFWKVFYGRYFEAFSESNLKQALVQIERFALLRRLMIWPLSLKCDEEKKKELLMPGIRKLFEDIEDMSDL